MSMFLSFLGGAAEQFTEDLKEVEKNAKAEATLKTKALYENYGEVLKQNRKLESELKNDVQFLEANVKGATQDQISAIVFNRPVMEMLKKRITDGDLDMKNFDINTFTGLTNQNASPFTAAQRIDAYLKIPKAQEAVDAETKGLGFFDRVSAEKQKAAMKQSTAALGVSAEQMQGAVGFRPTAPDLGAKLDATMLMKPKNMDKLTDAAQRELLEAQESGNQTAITSAKTRLKLIKDNKDMLSSDVENFNNKLAKLKTDAMSDDPNVRNAANKELAKEWELERRRKQATKIEGEGESKTPKLTALNSHAGLAAVSAISAKYGQQVKDGKIAITTGVNGEVSIRPMMTDMKLRQQVVQDAYRAAQMSLSLYVDKNGAPINDDVASVLNRFSAAVEFAKEEVPVDSPNTSGPKPPPKPKPAAAAIDIDAAREEARRVIAAGADPAKVKQAFKQRTGEDM